MEDGVETSGLIGIVLDHAGFAPVEQQQSDFAAAGITATATVAHMTAEDWHYRVLTVIEGAEHGVAVAGLHAFGLTTRAILDLLTEVLDRGVRLVVLQPDLDTAEDAVAVRALRAIISAVDQAGLIRTRAILDSLSTGETKSPPKARFVDRSDFERVTGA